MASFFFVITANADQTKISIQRGRYLCGVDIPEGSYIVSIPSESKTVSMQVIDKEGIPIVYTYLSNEEQNMGSCKIYLKESESIYIDGPVLIEKSAPIF